MVKNVICVSLVVLALCGLLIAGVEIRNHHDPQTEIVTYAVSGLKGKTTVGTDDKEMLNVMLNGYSGPPIKMTEGQVKDLKEMIERMESGVIIFHRKIKE